jgi:glycosyltransferase involved in cell wall biosynthesis
MSCRPLLVFADDWGRHPSSAQHLIGHLLVRHPVLWVNTIGTRTPAFNLITLRRGLERLRHWTASEPAKVHHPHLRVVTPWMWPWFSSACNRRLNRALLVKQLRPLLQQLSPTPLAITTLPIVADLVEHLPVNRWVYYCVDDFGQWPGLDGPALQSMEQSLLGKVDEVVAVSEELQGRLAQLGRSSRLLTHGVDLDFWQSGAVQGPLPEVTTLPRPLIVFWGVIDQRMDVELVRRVAQEMTTGTLLLVGPQQNPDPVLVRLPRVVCRSPVPYERLPSLAESADVLVMPYANLPVTRAMQPLKLKEYLATNKPIVVRDLPATRPWADCLDLATSAEEFSTLVKRRLCDGVPPSQVAARQRLEHESWVAKAKLFEGWISPRSERVIVPQSEMVYA